MKNKSARLAALGLWTTFLFAQQYDLVLSGGRVMDPETNLDAIRNIGVTGNRIAAISTAPLRGRDVIDAKGLVVAPGFIDLHSHGQTPENYRLKAYDGVTTALELEIGVAPIPAWYASREGKALINFMETDDAERYLGGRYEFMGVSVRSAEMAARRDEMRALAPQPGVHALALEEQTLAS